MARNTAHETAHVAIRVTCHSSHPTSHIPRLTWHRPRNYSRIVCYTYPSHWSAHVAILYLFSCPYLHSLERLLTRPFVHLQIRR